MATFRRFLAILDAIVDTPAKRIKSANPMIARPAGASATGSNMLSHATLAIRRHPEQNDDCDEREYLREWTISVGWGLFPATNELDSSL
mmetsp:Transcript_13575/g.27512  ORF Transcript_13575/g.27512 Transcript_13575/m.27512 type:complete len:89 (-) Transcript_13575:255-521(-)